MTNQEMIKEFTQVFFKPVLRIKQSNPEIGNLIVDIITELEKKYGVVNKQPESSPPMFKDGDSVAINMNPETLKEELKVISSSFDLKKGEWLYKLFDKNGEELYTVYEDRLVPFETSTIPESKFKEGDNVLLELSNGSKIEQKIIGKEYRSNTWFYQTTDWSNQVEQDIELNPNSSSTPKELGEPKFKVGEYAYVKELNDSEVYSISEVVEGKNKDKWQYFIKFDDGTVKLYDEEELEEYKSITKPEPKFNVGDNVLVKLSRGKKVKQIIIDRIFDNFFNEWQYKTTDFLNQSESNIELNNSTEDSKFKVGDKIIASGSHKGKVVDVVFNPNFKEPYEKYFYTISIFKNGVETIYYERTELDLKLDKSQPEPKFQKGQKVIYYERKGLIEDYKYLKGVGKYLYDVEFEDSPFSTKELLEDMLEPYIESKEEPLPKFKVGNFVVSKDSPSLKREISKVIWDETTSTPLWKYQTKEDDDFKWLEEELEFFNEPATRKADTSNTPLLKTDDIVEINSTKQIGVVTAMDEDKKKDLWRYTIWNYSIGQWQTKYYTELTLTDIPKPKYKVGQTIASKYSPEIERTIDKIQRQPNTWFYITNPTGLGLVEEDIMEYLPPASPEQKYHVGDYVVSESLPTVKREVTKCIFNKPTNKWEYYLDKEQVAFYYDYQLKPYEAPKSQEPSKNNSNSSSNDEPSIESELKSLSQAELKQRKKDIEEALTYLDDDDEEKIELESQLFYLNLYLDN